MTIDALNEFVDGQTAIAADVNANFATLVDYIETNCIVKNSADGVTTFETVPSGPATDPSTDNQLTRKSYVDMIKNSRTGIRTYYASPTPDVTFNGSGAVTVLATVQSDAVIPTNATNTNLTLEAIASCETTGTGSASFLGTVEVSFDNGATWETARRVSWVGASVGADASGYGGTSVQTLATKAYTGTAYVVKARFLGVQRTSNTNLHTAGTIQLALRVYREATLA